MVSPPTAHLEPVEGLLVERKFAQHRLPTRQETLAVQLRNQSRYRRSVRRCLPLEFVEHRPLFVQDEIPAQLSPIASRVFEFLQFGKVLYVGPNGLGRKYPQQAALGQTVGEVNVSLWIR